jgi:hypothetical protein
MTYLRTPGQSAANYKLGTVSSIRPRGLFFVRFRSAITDSNGVNSGLDFGFNVKSAELPKITAKTEDLTQYNKKRVIHTGYDTSPVTIVLNDTVKGTARKLWQSYLRNTFADFNHSDPSAWNSDTLQSTMLGDNIGFGFVTPDKDGAFGESARYYFETIEIYQVFGGTFTTTTLVNPRIQQFDADTLDYEDMAPMTFRMQLTYEAVLYKELQRLSDNRELYDIFRDTEGFGGDPYEPIDTGLGFLGGLGSQINDIANDVFTVGNAVADVAGFFGGQKAKAGVGGVLQQLSSTLSFGTQVAGLAGAASASIRNAKSIVKGGVTLKEAGSLLRTATNLGKATAGTINRISPQTYDSAYSKLTNVKGTPSTKAAVASGVMTATAITGAPVSSHVSNTSSGLSLSNEALGAINAQRSTTSFIGKRTKTK